MQWEKKKLKGKKAGKILKETRKKKLVSDESSVSVKYPFSGPSGSKLYCIGRDSWTHISSDGRYPPISFPQGTVVGQYQNQRSKLTHRVACIEQSSDATVHTLGTFQNGVELPEQRQQKATRTNKSGPQGGRSLTVLSDEPANLPLPGDKNSFLENLLGSIQVAADAAKQSEAKK